MHYGANHAPTPQIHAGLYADLQESFGPQAANAALDFSMYSIRHRSNTAQLFEQEMANQMRFNHDLWSDGCYSTLFGMQLTDAALHKFRTLWINRCAALGMTDVWLCIGGSNNDCAVDDAEFAEFGLVCKALDPDTNVMIHQLDRAYFAYMPNRGFLGGIL